jgi:tetratricopeptide (TPR) repeat protein
MKLAGVLLGIFMIGTTLWNMQMWKDSPTLVRWGVYSHEIPNDKFLMIHAKYGFLEQEPVVLQETLDALRKKDQIPDLPRDDARNKRARKCTIDALDLSIDILYGKYFRITGKPAESAERYASALRKYDHFVTTNQEVLLLERNLYEPMFKYLVMEFLFDINDEARITHFETWACNTTDLSGKIIPDYGIMGAFKYYKKDYQGAIDDWKKVLEVNKNAPDIIENIRRAEAKLNELK